MKFLILLLIRLSGMLLKTDVLRLKQILDNLLSNAVKFTNTGSITLSLELQVEANVVLFVVTDTGCGIPSEDIPNMFQRFSQVTSKKRSAGTGLGLYMSFSTIKGKFKGDIRFETEEGKGTTFFIELPKYTNENE